MGLEPKVSRKMMAVDHGDKMGLTSKQNRCDWLRLNRRCCIYEGGSDCARRYSAQNGFGRLCYALDYWSFDALA